jgi:hypothetical protein
MVAVMRQAHSEKARPTLILDVRTDRQDRSQKLSLLPVLEGRDVTVKRVGSRALSNFGTI